MSLNRPSQAAVEDPLSEYKRRLAARHTVLERHERLHVRMGNFRLVVAAVAVTMAGLVFTEHLFSLWWLLCPVAVFVGLAIVHERVLRGLQRAERAVAFYQDGVDRIEGRWAGKGEAGQRFLDEKHPYALDLDLFGEGGLFELLCTARTLVGQQTLARWLLAPSTPKEARARQQAVEELRSRVDLREKLSLLGEEAGTGVHAEALPRWGEAAPLLDSSRARVFAAVLACLAVLSLAGWGLLDLSPRWFLIVAAVEAGFGLLQRPQVMRVIQELEHPAHGLALVAQILSCFEQQRFSSSRMVELREALKTEGLPPSRRIAKLNRLIELLDSRDNLAVRVIGPPLLWTTQLAYAIEAWRKSTGGAVRRWLEAVGEIEALCALAGYAYEHPADPFPEFAETGPCFDGEGLGHPLIPEGRCVCNDVRLASDQQVLVVSGSNMSGKSTLLRTVGTNAVLAMAGAPVRAQRLRLSPLAVGATIRVTDSLQGGTSRFYAEITRLRRLVDMTNGSSALLFLLDELLHGTNSHDRRIGAEAVVRGLVERGAIGLITTHDLALAHIADVLAPHGANVHFEDTLENGQISFDYRLRPGVVEKSNALELMRSVGLKV
jgi:hypothetical protein